MLGFPQEDADMFRRFIRIVLEDVDQAAEERQALVEDGELDDYIDARIAEHIAHPRDDLTTFLLDAELDGKKLDPEHVRGTMVLLMIAGIDTTWSAIGASLWHLAQHPEDRRRLAAEPELMPVAVEEFLRAYAPVTMARLVAEDFDFDGCPMKQGDWVLLPVPGGQPRPGGVRRRRRGGARPGREPPRRVRSRHPPVPRVEPGPHGAAGRARGVDAALSRTSSWPTRARSPGRPARSAGRAPCRCASCRNAFWSSRGRG